MSSKRIVEDLKKVLLVPVQWGLWLLLCWVPCRVLGHRGQYLAYTEPTRFCKRCWELYEGER